MDPAEIQAKAAIAAALIVSGAVEVPSMPTPGHWAGEQAALRLRDLTEYLYRAIVGSPEGETPPPPSVHK